MNITLETKNTQNLSMPNLKKRITIKKSALLNKLKSCVSKTPQKAGLSSRLSKQRTGEKTSPAKITKNFNSPDRLKSTQASSMYRTVTSPDKKRSMYHSFERGSVMTTHDRQDLHRTSIEFAKITGGFSQRNKIYELSESHYMVKHPKKFSESFQGHFEIVPNKIYSKEMHVPTIELSKLSDRNLTRVQKLSSSFIGRRNLDKMLSADIPDIKKKHVQGFSMRKVTCRQELFGIK